MDPVSSMSASQPTAANQHRVRQATSPRQHVHVRQKRQCSPAAGTLLVEGLLASPIPSCRRFGTKWRESLTLLHSHQNKQATQKEKKKKKASFLRHASSLRPLEGLYSMSDILSAVPGLAVAPCCVPVTGDPVCLPAALHPLLASVRRDAGHMQSQLTRGSCIVRGDYDVITSLMDAG